jgi:hypothetical protein
MSAALTHNNPEVSDVSVTFYGHAGHIVTILLVTMEFFVSTRVLPNKTLILSLAVACTLCVAGVAVAESPADRIYAEPQVCRWVYRQDHRMMHCGAKSDMLALAPGKVPTAFEPINRRTKPKRRLINFTNDTSETVAVSAVSKSNAGKNSTEDSDPVAVETTVAPSFVGIAPKVASATARSSPEASPRPAPSVTKPVQPPAPFIDDANINTLYMVTALGDNKQVMTQLATIDDKDHRLLKSSDYKNRISLGIFGQTENAKRRQETLASQGIASELIERKYKRSTPQPRVVPPQPQQPIAYMVAALGDNSTVMAKLAELQDQDYVLLKRQSYNKRISLGIFSQISNAERRQRFLLVRGISSELIEHKRHSQTRPQIAHRL